MPWKAVGNDALRISTLSPTWTEPQVFVVDVPLHPDRRDVR